MKNLGSLIILIALIALGPLGWIVLGLWVWLPGMTEEDVAFQKELQRRLEEEP